MPQSRERHALYISLRRKIQKEHPEWGKEKVNEEVKAQLSVFLKEHKPNLKAKGSQDIVSGSQRGYTGSQQGAKHQSNSVSAKGSREVHNGSQNPQKIFVKVDHSVRKGQYVISESMDGISFRYVGTIAKGQPFERNGVIIIPTWHRGDGKDDQEISPAEAKSRIEKRWAHPDGGGE